MSKDLFKIDKGLNLPTRTLPVSPAEGDFVKDTADSKFKFYENSAWHQLDSDIVSLDSTTTGTGATLTPSTTAQIIRLSNASLVSLSMVASPTAGRIYTIINQTGNTITITNDSGATAANRIKTGLKTSVSLLDEASMIIKYDDTETRWMICGMSGVGVSNATPTVQRFTSSSGTYTTPAGVKYIKVSMIGGGGGGTSPNLAGNYASNAGNNGAATTFGTSLLTAGAGSGGVSSGSGGVAGAGGAGGTNTINAGPLTVINISGSQGSAGLNSTAATAATGGAGGNSPFGGGGPGGQNGNNGVAALANSGSGGGGASSAAGGGSGSGGGAGGFVQAIIVSPTTTYSYSIGAGGAISTASGGISGAAGGSGIIIVEEYYV